MKRSCPVLLLTVCCFIAVGAAGCGGETDVTTTSTTATHGTWTSVNPVGDTPPGRAWHSLVYDSSMRQVILFGGRVGTTDLDDTWSYDPATGTWMNLRPGRPPSPRMGHAMVYDPVSRKVILFGGYDGAADFDDTWAYDPAGNTWTRLSPAGAAPSARYGHAMTYDPVSDQIVLFGGFGHGGAYDDTWAYDPSENTWTQIDPHGPVPPARYGHTMTYEAVEGRLILHDGCDSVGAIFGDTWAYDPEENTWTELEPDGGAPPPRDWHSMVFDLANGRLLLFGGWSGKTVLGDTWAYYPALDTWVELDPDGSPPARDLCCLVYDLSGARVIMFGGYDGVTHFADVWAYRGTP